MSCRLVLPLLLSLIVVPIALAQVDPHLTTSRQEGNFVVNYYGARPDGTPCPPSVNALAISIDDGHTIRGLHSLGFARETDQAIAAVFAGACRVAFGGQVKVGMHHGTNATITPTSAQVIPTAPAYEGLFSVQYEPIICRVAPCPPGAYAIMDDAGNRLGRVDALLIDGPTGKTIARGEHLDWDSDIGMIWLDDSTLAEMLHFEAGESRARISLKPVI